MNFPRYLILALVILHININTHMLTLSNVPDTNAKSSIERTITIAHKCHYPFNPSSIVAILVFQQKGVCYISQGREKVRLALRQGSWKYHTWFNFFTKLFQKKITERYRNSEKKSAIYLDNHKLATYNLINWALSEISWNS